MSIRLIPAGRIITLPVLAEVQQAIVDAAIAVAGVPVRISKSLGPGPCCAPIPVRQVRWVVINVSADAGSLLIRHDWGGDLGFDVSLSLDESDTQVTIAIALPDLLREPNAPRAALLVDVRGLQGCRSRGHPTPYRARPMAETEISQGQLIGDQPC